MVGLPSTYVKRSHLACLDLLVSLDLAPGYCLRHLLVGREVDAHSDPGAAGLADAQAFVKDGLRVGAIRPMIEPALESPHLESLPPPAIVPVTLRRTVGIATISHTQPPVGGWVA